MQKAFYCHYDYYFRYELRDDRRKEIVRSSSHIDAVKRDIMRTMSITRFRDYQLSQNSVNDIFEPKALDDESRQVAISR